MNFSKKIRPGERLIKIIRRSPWSLGWSILASILLIFVPFLLMYSLFHLGTGGIIIFAYLILLGLILALQTFLNWYHNFFLITDFRVLIYRHHGTLENEILEISHEHVADISHKIKGLFANLVDYGQIKIEYSYRNQPGKIYLKNVPAPSKIQDTLVKLRDQALKNLNEKNKNFLSPEEILKKATMEDLFEVIRQVKNLIGEETFYKTFFKDKND